MGLLNIDIQGPELASTMHRHKGSVIRDAKSQSCTIKLVELSVRRRHKKGVLSAAPLFIISLSSDRQYHRGWIGKSAEINLAWEWAKWNVWSGNGKVRSCGKVS